MVCGRLLSARRRFAHLIPFRVRLRYHVFVIQDPGWVVAVLSTVMGFPACLFRACHRWLFWLEQRQHVSLAYPDCQFIGV